MRTPMRRGGPGGRQAASHPRDDLEQRAAAIDGSPASVNTPAIATGSPGIRQLSEELAVVEQIHRPAPVLGHVEDQRLTGEVR